MFRKIIFIGALLALAVIVMGAYVRLSDAGLGCPDWPGCYGRAVVSSEPADAAAAEREFPGSHFDSGKAWKEMTHRYLAGALAVVSLLLFMMSWRQKVHRRAAVGGSIALLFLVALQAALGMWAVQFKVMPVVVTAHLLMGMGTLWLLFWLFLRVNPRAAPAADRVGPKWTALFAILVVFLQILLGGWTSTNYAALACPDFPACHGSWWPEANYRDAFSFWHGLMDGSVAALLPADALVAVHWAHRVGALVTFVALTALVLIATSGRYQRRVRKAGVAVSVLLLLQISLGVASVKMGLPLAVALGHSAVAPLLLLTIVYLRFYSGHVVGEAAAAEVRAEAELVEAVPVAVVPEGVQAEAVPEEAYVEKAPETLFRRLSSQLSRTRQGLGSALVGLSLGHKGLDEDVLEEIEASLLMADVGIDATEAIIDDLNRSNERSKLQDSEAVMRRLRETLLRLLQPVNRPLEVAPDVRPYVILVVGVNGVGKTTTIGKLAKRLQAQGHSVMLAAGDTFRAAAVEQLQTWGERNQIQVIAQHTGADSASVIYDAVEAAKSRRVDILIADTAGRLHTKSNLMEELRKIKRIMGKLDETAPHEVLLVLDAGTGQNALSQAEQFNQAVEVTGLALTKLDGTAKGGVIFALARKFGIPIRFIGVGEGIDDLQDFHAEQFVDALFANESE